MKLSKLLEGLMSAGFIDDKTVIVLEKGKTVVEVGGWYKDKIIDATDEDVDRFDGNVTHNQIRIWLTEEG